jgi:hypothetical protein
MYECILLEGADSMIGGTTVMKHLHVDRIKNINDPLHTLRRNNSNEKLT